MEFYIFFIVLISLIVSVFIAWQMVGICTIKGYEETTHIFILCFFFTILGYLYVIALPDLTAAKQREDLIQLLKISQDNKSLNEQAAVAEENSTEQTKEINHPIVTIPNNLLETFKSMTSVQEMLDYVNNANNIDDEVIKIIEDMASLERLYGNMKTDCIQKLSRR